MPINEIAALLDQIARTSFSIYWMPMAIWSMVAFAFLLLRKGLDKKHPILNYQVISALLLSLPFGMLLAYVSPMALPAPDSLQDAVIYIIPSAAEELALQSPAADTATVNWGPMHALGLLVSGIALLALWQFGWLCAETMRLYRIGRSLEGNALNDIDGSLEQLRADWGIAHSIQVVFSQTEQAPMTFGWRKPFIIVPASLSKDPEALRLALLHEMIHIRQGDYVRQWLEQSIKSIFFFHPLVHQLTNWIDRYREMTCDTEVLNQQGVSAKRYASLLLAFSQPHSIAPQPALSMADSSSNLKERIRAMKQHGLFGADFLRSRKTGFLLAALLLVISSAIVACEIKIEDNSITINEAPNTETGEGSSISGQAEEAFMVVEDMPELIGGLGYLQTKINYPAIAEKAGIEGRVFIQFVVNTEGIVENPVVVRGIGGGCDEEAIRAVKEARFRPGRQRGKPVPVKMTLPINFRLKKQLDPVDVSELKRELTLLQKIASDITEAQADLKLKLVAAQKEGNSEEALRLRQLIDTYKLELEAIPQRIESIASKLKTSSINQ